VRGGLGVQVRLASTYDRYVDSEKRVFFHLLHIMTYPRLGQIPHALHTLLGLITFEQVIYAYMKDLFFDYDFRLQQLEIRNSRRNAATPTIAPGPLDAPSTIRPSVIASPPRPSDLAHAPRREVVGR
jgi:hypothetical protein